MGQSADGTSFSGSVAASGGSATVLYAAASDLMKAANQGPPIKYTIYNADASSSISITIPNLVTGMVLIPGQSFTAENPRGIASVTAISTSASTALVNSGVAARGDF